MTPTTTPKTEPLILYHANCTDGFAAAYAAWLWRPDAEFIPMSYSGEMPFGNHIAHRHVFILDFSFDKEYMDTLSQVAASVTILDHHESAHRRLLGMLEDRKIRGKIDRTHSGAVLAWQYFHPNISMPMIYKYIEDRDLWTKKYIESDVLAKAISSYDMDFVTWRENIIGHQYTESKMFTKLLKEGNAINRYQRQLIDNAINNTRVGYIKGYSEPVLLCNCHKMLVSDMAEIVLSPNVNWHACNILVTYHMRGDAKWEFSLRSRDTECLHIAEKFGGGGHPRACGFVNDLGIDDVITSYY